MPDEDGHWPDGGLYGGLQLGYAYRVVNGLELGVAAGYEHRITPPVDRFDILPEILLPTVTVRAFGQLDSEDRREVGLSARFGGLIMRMKDVPDYAASSRDHIWTGYSVAIVPDLRVRSAPNTAFQFSPEFAFGTGHDSGRILGYYLRRDCGFGQLGVWVGVVQSL